MEHFETAADYFAGLIDSYDSLIRRAVPRYDDFTGRLVDYLPAGAEQILELGCGTGNLSLALAARFPAAHLTFVDAAEEMITLTRKRIEAALPDVATRTHFVMARFEELRLEPGSFDVITSSCSLHHVRDKSSLFAALHRILRAHGRLCFVDQMRAAPEASQRRNWEDWLAFCRAPGHCSEEEIESLIAHAEAHDHYETAGEHIDMLRRIGFREVDCLWRENMWCIITATAGGATTVPAVSP